MAWYQVSYFPWGRFCRKEKITLFLMVLCVFLYAQFIFSSRYQQESNGQSQVTGFEYQNLPVIQRLTQEASSAPISSDECWDPYSSQLLNEVEQNCSAFRFVTIPDDGGRYGHGITQAYILFVFLRQFEAKKAAVSSTANSTSNLTHVPVLPRQKETLLCQLFQRPPNTYLRKELVQQICSVNGSSWVSTSFASWEANFDALSKNNIHFTTWPMPRMYLANNSDIFQLFTLRPGWMFKGDELKRHLLGNATLTSGEVGFAHVRRQDYTGVIASDYKPGVFNGSHIQTLITRELTKRPNSTCLILSDDDEWCKKNLELGPRVILAKATHPEVAFALMVQCDFSISTYGSFGLWGGLLNGGKMVRLLPRLENNTELAGHFEGQEDILPNIEIVYYP
jgi:hypothetical protein